MSVSGNFLKSRRRSCQAAVMSEFPVALFVLLFFAFFPVCNLVFYMSAYIGLRGLTMDTVQAVAMSDSRQQAEEREKTLLANYQNPLLTLFHHVQLKSSDVFQIIVDKGDDKPQTFDVAAGLPKSERPGNKGNDGKALYFYRLTVTCTVDPILNLSFIPFLKLVPMIGGPSQITISAQAPVENIEALNR